MNKAIAPLPLILLSLLLAIWGGWIRIGWSLPVSQVAAQHGAMMVGSFLATLVLLERAVTFQNKWVLLLPVINGLSVIAFLVQQPELAQLFLIAGSLGFTLICGYFIKQYKELYNYVFFAGALCLLIGNVIIWKTNFYPNAVTWWIGFLLFTIVAERLELSRFIGLSSFKRNLLLLALGSVGAGLIWPFHYSGNVVFALSILAIALWLLKYDMAWFAIRKQGPHRYSGLLLIFGYAWLVITAALFLAGNHSAFGYDAALHSFFIGFVFSMIFSHAPIIFPAVLKLPLKIYRPVLYVWFALLQTSLVLRIVADVIESIHARRIAGLLNGVAILLFFVTIAVTVKMELKKWNRTKRRVLNVKLETTSVKSEL
ncbi:hypothetical protein OCK74_21490 [Chitinophagaceae bacterium LB-8]|uniref:NnrS family protein n=1 Tax=Paraflavisolibacter caeni TaxID=2982496 RepID=A0A9X3BGZ0_9BACT|nr:hypothetical protein [Paraflavisolibacter caeni]MCU7551709.1 hypothetical protein [Paraflavisolibacter caeni]